MKRILKIAGSMVGIILILFIFLNGGTIVNSGNGIKYSEFIEKIENGEIEKVEISNTKVVGHTYEDNKTFYANRVEDSNLIGIMRDSNVEFEQAADDSSFGGAVALILPLLLLMVPFILFFRFMNDTKNQGIDRISPPMGMAQLGRNKGKIYKNESGITFDDVAGQDEAKESLAEIIDYLHNAKKYIKMGAKIPKGVLLVGPPGTGKTLIAKAVAGEAKVPFFSLSGSDFIEMFVGVGASRVRDLFETAKKSSPCIIFIDEIDAIGKSRSGAAVGGSNEYDQTLNQLLAEMDGFETGKAVIVIGATNRPEVLDKALLRTGRFDRRVIIDKPDLKGRIDTLKVHSKDIMIDESVDMKEIALATSGAVGSDLANIINEAALAAVRLGKKKVSQSEIMDAVEIVFAGKEKKDKILNKKEKQLIAYHEVGHAVVAAMQKGTAPVQKITIVPRTMGSLGYTMQVPEEEKYLLTRDDIISETRTLLGGRCAEEVFFGAITTGASNDIEKATKKIRSAITIYGMSEKFDMVALESLQNVYLDQDYQSACSAETESAIDREVGRIIRTLHNETRELLKANKDLIKEIAEYLLEKENITGSEFMDIFRKYVKDGCTAKFDNNTVFKDDKSTETVVYDVKKEKTKVKLPEQKIDITGSETKTDPQPEHNIPCKVEIAQDKKLEDKPKKDSDNAVENKEGIENKDVADKKASVKEPEKQKKPDPVIDKKPEVKEEESKEKKTDTLNNKTDQETKDKPEKKEAGKQEPVNEGDAKKQNEREKADPRSSSRKLSPFELAAAQQTKKKQEEEKQEAAPIGKQTNPQPDQGKKENKKNKTRSPIDLGSKDKGQTEGIAGGNKKNKKQKSKGNSKSDADNAMDKLMTEFCGGAEGKNKDEKNKTNVENGNKTEKDPGVSAKNTDTVDSKQDFDDDISEDMY